MPFTPYHLGPALLFGVILFPFVDITALLLSSVLVDVEPLYVIMFAPGLPYHGILHTYVGATGIAILNAVIVWFLRDWTRQILAIFKIDQNSSFIRIFGISLLGMYSHVLLDSFLYPEMNPFFPLMGNRFLGSFHPQLSISSAQSAYSWGSFSIRFAFWLFPRLENSTRAKPSSNPPSAYALVLNPP